MRINYFNFKRINSDSFLITNDLGNYCFVTKDEFDALLRGDRPENANELIAKGFLIDGNIETFIRSITPKMQLAKCHLFTATELFIFVLTKRCNQNCVYCQAKAGEFNSCAMDKEIAKLAVDTALSSPSYNITFEFQGGEPLFSFDILKYIVEYTEQKRGEKHVFYSLVSNLTLLNDEIIGFITKYSISICTSLDGPELVHDANRPMIGGYGSFEKLERNICRIHNAGIPLSAIETTTKQTIPYVDELVDTYCRLGFTSIFIRPLTPLGQAEEHWEEIGYSPEEFCQFYKRALEYIIKLNKDGKRIIENHARILLSKILGKGSENYMELRSPCGAAIGQMAFFYDGYVYTCDEGRMMAEMGENVFRLGRIGDSYDTLISSSSCKAVSTSSVLESLPGCSDCVYMPYCGVCPVVNYRSYRDVFSKQPNSFKCKIYKGILDILFEFLHLGDYNTVRILHDWVGFEL